MARQIEDMDRIENDERVLPEQRLLVSSAASTLENAKGQENEDAYFRRDDVKTYGVFDGVGGRSKGAEAAQTARDYVSSQVALIPATATPIQVAESLGEILRGADKAVSQIESTSDKPASTASILKVVETENGRYFAAIAHVGDTRVYRFNPTKIPPLQCLTVDDNSVLKANFPTHAERVNAQARLDNYTDPSTIRDQRDLAVFRRRNEISQALNKGEARPTTAVYPLDPGDVMILTTDGIHDPLTAKQIEAICARKRSPDEIAQILTVQSREKLFDENNKRRKNDDATAVVVYVDDEKSSGLREVRRLRDFRVHLRGLKDAYPSETSELDTTKEEQQLLDVLDDKLKIQALTRKFGIRSIAQKLKDEQLWLRRAIDDEVPVFEGCADYDEIEDNIRLLGKVSGINGSIPVGDLIRSIQAYRRGDDQAILRIPRKSGLRTSLVRIINRDKMRVRMPE